MNHYRLPLLMGFLAAFLCSVACPVMALDAKADRVNLLFKRFLSQVNQLEEKYPQDHASFFKLRSTVNDLFKEAEALKEISASVQPAAAAGSRQPVRVGDPMQGINQYATCRNLRGNKLREELHGLIAIQYPVGYQAAQDLIFSKIDNHDGEVECVYTGRRLHTQGEPDASNMNVEHTWPQSQGATGDAKCDLHHLFPTDSKANSIRGNYPFGNVTRPEWEEGGSKFDGDIFEPRSVHKGNCARAKFYFAVRYGKQIPAAEEEALRQWHKEDPVDAAERTRNDQIENAQHNRNPFVDHPEFVDQISDF